METPTIWYLPSFYGDIRLEKAVTTIEVHTTRLTQSETEALEKLRAHAVKQGWLEKLQTFQPNGMQRLRTDNLPQVAKVLAKALKPTRETLSAVRIEGGKIEEIYESTFAMKGELITKEGGPYREEEKVAKAPRKTAAVTVARPALGCPAPDFPAAEIKAREVLSAFLTPEQLEDFQNYNRFIARGAVTGHRYMITSRLARDALARYQRSLFDLDTEEPFCVHDWMVPPAEEMLALKLCVELPAHELYVRHLEGGGI